MLYGLEIQFIIKYRTKDMFLWFGVIISLFRVVWSFDIQFFKLAPWYTILCLLNQDRYDLRKRDRFFLGTCLFKIVFWRRGNGATKQSHLQFDYHFGLLFIEGLDKSSKTRRDLQCLRAAAATTSLRKLTVSSDWHANKMYQEIVR